jgi:hypothetical protein
MTLSSRGKETRSPSALCWHAATNVPAGATACGMQCIHRRRFERVSAALRTHDNRRFWVSGFDRRSDRFIYVFLFLMTVDIATILSLLPLFDGDGACGASIAMRARKARSCWTRSGACLAPPSDVPGCDSRRDPEICTLQRPFRLWFAPG